MDTTDAVPARIFLRPIGAPLPLGMAGLAIASLVVSGLELHWIPLSQGHSVGLILVAVGFTLQLLASVFSYLARDGSAGTCLGVLSTTWLALGLIHIVSKPGHRSGALGLLLLAAGGALFLSALTVSRTKPLPALVFFTVAIRFALAGIYQLAGTPVWQHASGIVGLVVTGFAAYCLVAFELESQRRAPVLPTLRRGRGATAVHDGARAQLDGIAREPGVRQTS